MHDPPSVSALLAESAEFANAIERALSSADINWNWRPGEEEWSLTEVICHLRDVEREVHQVRFRRLIDTANVFLAGHDSDVWVEQRQYKLQDGPTALQEFLNARRQTVVLLESIEDEAMWERNSQHAIFGITSMHELLNLAVRHDRIHWEQIAAYLGH